MLSIDPATIPTPQLHGYLLGAVAPRPICFASTVSSDGQVNLSPFSFFNVFSANPPVMIFSPARRVRDNTTKHTLENVQATGEVVINIVSYDMVQQMSLSSTEYPQGVNEFEKAGFTELPSDLVQPPRVAEAPVQFECKVNEVIPLGAEGGAGNLIIAQVVRLHVNEGILDEQGKIDPVKLDPVSRLGGNWYGRSKLGLFEVPKPLRTLGIGVDSLPESVRQSTILTGNDLGRLGNLEALPEVAASDISTENMSLEDVHKKAQLLIGQDRVEEALALLLKEENTE
ncbi:flavin reductase family protein [Aureitalea marina]|uniref:Flavin reductase n=1 Tax=Aureitalea marina TaxID=930804 RepID=A0A2S7KT67_9FLAO|nr:flavin reductase family protein [Aureitalea marina]PQB05806.1 flavin reductase [Aureitalea marina]